jgi:RNA polymerase sigma-70 factor (ECF subfamily)
MLTGKTSSTSSSTDSRGSADFKTEVLPLRDELLAVALRYTRNRSDAEDLVQDTITRALGAWERFEPGTNCRAWLFRILTNSFINGYRRRKRHRRFTDEKGEDTAIAMHGELSPRRADPSRAVVEECLGDQVSAALDTLGPDYRQVVEMADLGGQRYKDIAKKLGVPIGTVMSRLFRARRQLESLLADYAAADYGIRRAAA